MIFKNIILFFVIILFSGIITSQYFLTENLNNQFMYSSEMRDQSLCSTISEYGSEQPMNLATKSPTVMPTLSPIGERQFNNGLNQPSIDLALMSPATIIPTVGRGPSPTPSQTTIGPTPSQTTIEPTPSQTTIEPTPSQTTIGPTPSQTSN
jgi:hypothetical protein